MAMYFSNAMKKDRHALTPFKGRYQELVLLMLSSAAIGGLLTGSMFSTEPLPETMLIPAPGTHGKRLGYMPPASKGKMEMLQMEASAPKKEDMWVETVLLEPRVFLVHNILSLSECDHLIALAKRHGMQKALIQPYGESGLVESSTRTNTAAWLNFKEDSVVASLEEKMAALTGTTPEQAENLQILHYAHGKEFKAHHDFFDPATDPPENFAQGGNRRYTFLVYLQTPEEGGGTKFMHPNVTIKADPGTAILFYDMKDVHPAPLCGSGRVTHAFFPVFPTTRYHIFAWGDYVGAPHSFGGGRARIRELPCLWFPPNVTIKADPGTAVFFYDMKDVCPAPPCSGSGFRVLGLRV